MYPALEAECDEPSYAPYLLWGTSFLSLKLALKKGLSPAQKTLLWRTLCQKSLVGYHRFQAEL